MVKIDSLDSTSSYAFGYCTVRIVPPLTEGLGAFEVTIPQAYSAGRAWLTRYGALNLTGATKIEIDVQQNQPKNWQMELTDILGAKAQVTAQGGSNLLTFDLSGVTINLSQITQISYGVQFPADTTYLCIIDNMRDDRPLSCPVGTHYDPITQTCIPDITSESEPANNTQIRVDGNLVTPLHKATWYAWFLDTPSGWFPLEGETWSDAIFTRWNESAARAVLQDMKNRFGFNMVRTFFWMQNYLDNSTKTMSSFAPNAEIGLKDALHRFVQIAKEEGLHVTLDMWDWDSATGKTSNPLATHTKQQYIDAWLRFAGDFAQYDNVVFYLFDEPDAIGLTAWFDLAKSTILALRTAGIGHVIYVHWKYCGGEGIDWIRQFGLKYQVAFSRAEYIAHGTTEAMHQDTLTIKREGYPVTMTAGGARYNNPTQIETYRRWYQEFLAENMGIAIYNYGRPALGDWVYQRNMAFPCLPNENGQMWIDTLGIVTPPPEQKSLICTSAGNGSVTPSATYDINTEVTITATPDEGFKFSKWTINGLDFLTASVTLSMSEDMTATAYFEAITEPPTQEAGLGVAALLALIVLIIGVVAASIPKGGD